MKLLILISFTVTLVLSNTVMATGPVFSNLSAGAHDAGIVTSNPAGMAYLRESTWQAGVIISYSESTWEASSSGLGRSTKTDTENTLYMPSLYYVYPLNDRWTMGASLSATSGIGDDNGGESVTRYLSKEWSLGSFTFQPSVAYRLDEDWSIGAGVGINYTRYSWEAAVFNGIGQPDGEVETEPDDIDFNFILGLHWTPGERIRFGVSYRSEYSPNLKDSPDYSGVNSSRQSDSDIELEVTMPRSVLAGVYHGFDNGHWLSFDVLWVEASKFNIESAVADSDGSIITNSYNLNNTWIFSGGWGMPLNNQWDVGLGVLYVHDPIDDSNRNILLRVDSLWGVGASAERHLKNGMSIGANLSYLFTGNSQVQTQNLPVLGVVEGEFTDRANILFQAYLNW